MKRKVLLIIIICIAAAVLVFCIFKLGSYYLEADSEQNEYDALSAYIELDSDVNDEGDEYEIPANISHAFKIGFFNDEKYIYDPDLNDFYSSLANRNIDALCRDFPDISCWIYIPGTQISYPVMSSEGEYYLRRNFKGESAKAGALFFMNNLGFEPQNDNIVIHGHNMKSGLMFGSLKAFWIEEYMWTGSNYFYIDLPGGITQKYQMFAIYIDNTTEHPIPTDFSSSEEKINYLNSCKNKSKYKSDMVFSENDKIITLSTCTHLENAGSYDRLIIQAKLVN